MFVKGTELWHSSGTVLSTNFLPCVHALKWSRLQYRVGIGTVPLSDYISMPFRLDYERTEWKRVRNITKF